MHRLQNGAFWIIEHDDEAVGTVRIDDGRLSIALAATARGKGLGKIAHELEAACMCGRVGASPGSIRGSHAGVIGPPASDFSCRR